MKTKCCFVSFIMFFAMSFAKMDKNNIESFSTTNINVLEQSLTHKTYEGPYPAFDFPKNGGKAKYQYIENYDGSRIFDGDFEYQTNGLKVKGQFKNDYQVGQWHFIGDNHTITINFNTNGYPDGEFVIYEIDNYLFYDNDELKCRVKMRDVKYSGIINNGIITQIEHITSQKYDLILFYDKEECNDAYIKGNDRIKWKKYTGFYTIDNSTGDEKYVEIGKIGGFGSYETRVYSIVKDNLKKCLMRSSDRK